MNKETKNTTIQTVVATERYFENGDGNYRSLSMNFKVEEGVNLLEACKKAALEYCLTEEGKKTYEGNCNAFNWGDFYTDVPNDICRKYGIEQIGPDTETISVDLNEQLVVESDVLPEE